MNFLESCKIVPGYILSHQIWLYKLTNPAIVLRTPGVDICSSKFNVYEKNIELCNRVFYNCY